MSKGSSRNSKHGKKHHSSHSKEKTELKNDIDGSSSSEPDILDGPRDQDEKHVTKERHSKHKRGKKQSSKTHDGISDPTKHDKHGEDEAPVVWVPDYHWENHSSNNHHHGHSTSKATKKAKAQQAAADKRLKRLSEGDTTDMVFDPDTDGVATTAVPQSAHDWRTAPSFSSDSEAMGTVEEECDEDTLGMEEDEALRTTPPSPPVVSPCPVTLENLPADLDPASPRAAKTSQHHHDSATQNMDGKDTPTTSSVGQLSPPQMSRSSLLGPEMMLGPSAQQSRPSFMPPFLMNSSDSDDENDGDAAADTTGDTSATLGDAAHGSHSSSSSPEDWTVPEALGMDEGIPQVNQERCHSLLHVN